MQSCLLLGERRGRGAQVGFVLPAQTILVFVKNEHKLGPELE